VQKAGSKPAFCISSPASMGGSCSACGVGFCVGRELRASPYRQVGPELNRPPGLHAWVDKYCAEHPRNPLSKGKTRGRTPKFASDCGMRWRSSRFRSSSVTIKCRRLRPSRSSRQTTTTSKRRRRASFRSWSSAGRRSLAPLTPRSTYSADVQPRAATYRRSSAS
jgi:hypothetical protein